jgi:hypothetical protein
MGRFDKNSPISRLTFLAMDRSQSRNARVLRCEIEPTSPSSPGWTAATASAYCDHVELLSVAHTAGRRTEADTEGGVLRGSGLTVNDRGDELPEVISQENLSIRENW